MAAEEFHRIQPLYSALGGERIKTAWRLCVRPDNDSPVLGKSLIVFIGLTCKNRS